MESQLFSICIRYIAFCSAFKTKDFIKSKKYLYDMHTFSKQSHLDPGQDVASSKFGTYDGFPPWLLHKLRCSGKKHILRMIFVLANINSKCDFRAKATR